MDHGPPFPSSGPGQRFFLGVMLHATPCSLLLYVTGTDFWRGRNHATMRRDGTTSAAVIMPPMHDRPGQTSSLYRIGFSDAVLEW